MCGGGAPRTPKVEKVPDRQPMMLPDGGDPAVRMALRGARRLTTSAMIFAGRGGTLGAPATTATLGTGGM